MRPIGILCVLGSAVPILLGGLAAIDKRPVLGAVAFVLALVLPSLGHVVYRRTIWTRGFRTRLVGAGFAGLFVVMAQGAELGPALVLAALALFGGPIVFLVGAVFDIADAQAASAARSRNV